MKKELVSEVDPRDVNLLFKEAPIPKVRNLMDKDKADALAEETLTSTKTYKEAQAELKLEVQKEYDIAIKEFYEDNSYFDGFKDCEPFGKEVLVKIFHFTPSRTLANRRALGQTSLIISGKFDKELKTTTEAVYDKYYPVVKVIKKGPELPNIEIGALYAVPAIDVEGKQWNPDFLHYMNTFARADNGKQGMVHVPEDMPQKIDSLVLNWDRYRFKMPGSVEESNGDFYLIPSVKLKTPYRV